jgi:hypothetical protein
MRYELVAADSTREAGLVACTACVAPVGCEARASEGVELMLTAMEIGEPRRTYTVEPLEDPVPRELPEEAPERERPAEAPGEPEQVPGPAR